MKSKSSRKKSTRSGRTAKKLPVDPAVILEKLAALPISTWNYKWDDPKMRHIGPMAQDFSRIFGVGDHHGINLGDAFGVAYASIQALRKITAERGREIRSLRRALDAIRRRQKTRS